MRVRAVLGGTPCGRVDVHPSYYPNNPNFSSPSPTRHVIRLLSTTTSPFSLSCDSSMASSRSKLYAPSPTFQRLPYYSGCYPRILLVLTHRLVQMSVHRYAISLFDNLMKQAAAMFVRTPSFLLAGGHSCNGLLSLPRGRLDSQAANTPPQRRQLLPLPLLPPSTTRPIRSRI